MTRHQLVKLSLVLIVGGLNGMSGEIGVARAGVTAVSAPNLLRPMDGLLRPFNVQVSGVYDNWGQVAVGANYYAEYWDDDGLVNDPIDLHPAPALIVPAGGAAAAPGTPWGPIAHTFEVGCTVGGIVFGPAGATGENPMDDGMFRFDGLWNWWGYNSVTCIPAPVPPPVIPPPVWNGVPIPTTPVPEPGTLGLGAISGFLMMLGRRR